MGKQLFCGEQAKTRNESYVAYNTTCICKYVAFVHLEWNVIGLEASSCNSSVFKYSNIVVLKKSSQFNI